MPDAPEADDLSRALDAVGRAEIVVGISGFNSARTIRQVMEAVAAGLTTYYPGTACVIVAADGGSRDGTLEAARAADTGACPVAIAAPAARGLAPLSDDPGWPGKGAGLRTILAATERVGAAACAVVDADVGGIAPAWVPRLLEPVLRQGLDLVAPLYARHKYDGMLTSFLVYPLTRALYGRRLRQPVGGHYGVSAALAARLRTAGAWGGTARRYRRDLWMATVAAAEGMAVGQAYLGVGRPGPRDTGAALGTTLAEVAGTAFALMEDYRTAWWSVVETGAVPTFGDPPAAGVEPVSVNVDRMVTTFRQGVADLMPVWRRLLGAETSAAVAELAAAPSSELRFPAALWARVVYDAAVASHQRVLPRDHLLRALLPLYLGRAAAYVLGTASADAAEAEADVESLCGHFESMKPYLLDQWDTRRP